MGTDAQAEEEDRKGPVRQRQETGTAARLSSLGVPQQPGGGYGGTPSGSLFFKVPITIQKHRPKPKFCQADNLKPLVPTKSHHPLPQTAAWGWAGAIFSLGSELILTHQQET